MTEPALRVRKLGKRYLIRRAAAAPPRGFWGGAPAAREELWALRDADFEIQRGEVVGIIGRNGSGKTTLLKILSRVTWPTEGRAEVRGRVGSLLEVGTGFHPDLTGRENIYLNGAILGMRKPEIDRRFEEMAAFAEIGGFLETPVKWYSSGMYLRLAFAVAAHLDPEILFVDEVLAVGDLAFQSKCLGRLNEAARQGRTVLFVSHNLNAVRQLCARALLLEGGRILADGPAREVISVYCERLKTPEGARSGVGEGGKVRGMEVSFGEGGRGRSASWERSRPLTVEVRLQTEERSGPPGVDLAFYTLDGLRLFALQSDRLGAGGGSEGPARGWRYRFVADLSALMPQALYADVGVRWRPEGEYICLWNRALELVLTSQTPPDCVYPASLVHPKAEVEARAEGAGATRDER